MLHLVKDEGWHPAFSVENSTLDVIDLDLLAASATDGLVVAIAVLVELEATVAILIGSESIRLVDLGSVRELAIGFAGGGLECYCGDRNGCWGWW